MNVQVEKVGALDLTVLKPEGTLDASTSKQFKQQAQTALEGSRRVLMDLAQVSFIDSSGLAVILSLVRQLTQQGGEFKLCGATKPVQAVLEMVRMPRVVDTLKDREQGLQSFQ